MNQNSLDKNEDQLFIVVCQSNKHHENSLTVGLSYSVYDQDDTKYIIKNDKNELKQYYKSRFKK